MKPVRSFFWGLTIVLLHSATETSPVVQVCRTRTFIDTDARPGWMAGTLQFGEAHASGKMPVQGIQGYRVFMADDCGEQVGMVGMMESLGYTME